LPANINLAVVLNRQGQVDQANKCLLKVLEYDPENIEAHYNLGLLWEKQGVEAKALEHYQKFVSKARGPYIELAEELKKRWPALK
jgi:Tfp pilus assembly protein PilF